MIDIKVGDTLLLRDLDISGTVLEIDPETDPDSALIESDDGKRYRIDLTRVEPVTVH